MALVGLLGRPKKGPKNQLISKNGVKKEVPKSSSCAVFAKQSPSENPKTSSKPCSSPMSSLGVLCGVVCNSAQNGHGSKTLLLQVEPQQAMESGFLIR